MFGSLVVIFPTPHEGGALSLRHRGHEWIIDSGRELAFVAEPSVGYVAFFSDVEHEVEPVISGHRVTLTYNLYFDEKSGTVSSSKEAASEHPSLPPAPNENAFRETFQVLLENPEFLPDGGTLAFGMRHVYPIPRCAGYPTSLEPIYGALKGSDAVIWQTARVLGFQPVLYLYYEVQRYLDRVYGAATDKVIDPTGAELAEYCCGIERVVVEGGGFQVFHERGDGDDEGEDDYDDDYDGGEYEGSRKVERVEWVTPAPTFNSHQTAYMTYGNEPSLGMAYADLCMFVRIGKAGERLMYPSVEQLRKEWENEHKNRWR
jgi:hypothetical protein